MPPTPEFPKWDPAKPLVSLTAIHDWAIAKAKENITWYQVKRGTKKRWSQYLRAGSIVLAGIGALCPLIDATKIAGDKVALGQWGYVSLALAAALIGYDRFFGLSTGWMRYIVTELSLERALKEFEYDWTGLLSTQDPAKIDSILLLEKMKAFTLRVEDLVRQETDAWILEFQSNIAGLEKMLKAEVEVRKPGGIKVSVPNARDFVEVAVFLNNTQRKELTGVTEALFDSVPPGRHEVTVVGKKNGKDSKAAKVLEVQANATAAVEMSLPTT